jgi:hypothetical protein
MKVTQKEETAQAELAGYCYTFFYGWLMCIFLE